MFSYELDRGYLSNKSLNPISFINCRMFNVQVLQNKDKTIPPIPLPPPRSPISYTQLESSTKE